MNRKLNHSMLTVLGLLTLKAQAVGLGEIVVHSKLGEPLSAEIGIIQANGEFIPADQITVNIADESEHAKRNLDGFLARKTLELKLEETLSEDVALTLNSSQPINEPFLNFLLELKWSSGHLIKEFTVLLDPPGFEPTTTTPLNTTKITATNNQTTTVSVRPKTIAKTTQRPLAKTPFVNGQYGPVQRGETLSEIAMLVRPAGHGIRLGAMIDSIYLKNPDAFINGNKNLLLENTILEIPSADEVIALTTPTQSSLAAQTPPPEDRLITNLNDSINNVDDSIGTYTFSTLKLSTELNQAFLSASEINNIEIESSTTESEITSPVVDVADNIDESASETNTADVSIDEENNNIVVSEPITSEDNVATETLSTTTEETSAVITQDNNETSTQTSQAVIFNPAPSATEESTSSTDYTITSNRSSSNILYLLMAILGGIIIIGAGVFWLFARRNREMDFRPNAQVNINKANTASSNRDSSNTAEDAKPIATQTKSVEDNITAKEPSIASNDAIDDLLIEETKIASEKSVDDFSLDMQQANVNKEESIKTVIMSPEEFAQVGIDNPKSTEDLDAGELRDEMDLKDDQSLIDDFLDTVEIDYAMDDLDSADEELPMKEHISDSSIEKAMDALDMDMQRENKELEASFEYDIPFNHPDNEVNTIMNDLLQGDYTETDDQSDLTENSIDDEELDLITEEPIEIHEAPLSSESEQLEIEAIDFNNDALIQQSLNETEDAFDANDISSSDLEAPELFDPDTQNSVDYQQPNLEDLVVNFTSTNPDKEFEKQVSVFMAYGDYNGAEEVIEKALQTDPDNHTYKIAQLSLFKATGKFGAALVLSEELTLIKHELSEINQKKLELLSDDLKQSDDDDNSINFAS